MSRFEDFIKGMEKVYGPINGATLSEKNFPPLLSNPKPNLSSHGVSAPPAVSLSPANSNPHKSTSKAESSGMHGVVQLVAPLPIIWSSLFHSDQAAKLQFHHPLVADGKPSAFIPKSVHKLRFSAWEDCHIGQFWVPLPLSLKSRL